MTDASKPVIEMSLTTAEMQLAISYLNLHRVIRDPSAVPAMLDAASAVAAVWLSGGTPSMGMMANLAGAVKDVKGEAV